MAPQRWFHNVSISQFANKRYFPSTREFKNLRVCAKQNTLVERLELKASGCQLWFLCCLQVYVIYVWVRDFINLCAQNSWICRIQRGFVQTLPHTGRVLHDALTLDRTVSTSFTNTRVNESVVPRQKTAFLNRFPQSNSKTILLFDASVLSRLGPPHSRGL